MEFSLMENWDRMCYIIFYLNVTIFYFLKQSKHEHSMDWILFLKEFEDEMKVYDEQNKKNV